jgi:L-ribulose-5-phosphate 3-epimerase UlaE
VSVEEKVIVVVVTEMSGCEFIELSVDSSDEIVCPCPTDLFVVTME